MWGQRTRNCFSSFPNCSIYFLLCQFMDKTIKVPILVYLKTVKSQQIVWRQFQERWTTFNEKSTFCSNWFVFFYNCFSIFIARDGSRRSADIPETSWADERLAPAEWRHSRQSQWNIPSPGPHNFHVHVTKMLTIISDKILCFVILTNPHKKCSFKRICAINSSIYTISHCVLNALLLFYFGFKIILHVYN